MIKSFSGGSHRNTRNKVGENYGIVYTVPEDLKQAYLKIGIKLEEYNGYDSWRLPLLSRYIINRQGIIQYAVVSACGSYRKS